VRAGDWLEISVGLRAPLVESQQFCRMQTEGEMVPLMNSLPRYTLKREEEDEMIYETIRLLPYT